MTTIQGNLTKIEKGIIFQCVNAQNCMGSGLAKSLFTKWPKIKNQYHEFCKGKKHLELLGQCHFVEINSQLLICNVFGQLFYGNSSMTKERYADYGAIKSALSFAQYCIELNGQDQLPIYFPKLFAADLAGGKAEIIHEIIQMFFENAILVEYKE